MLNELDAAGEKLEQDLLALFQCRQLMPAAVVDCIDHAGYCEDGRTFMVTCTTVDGGTLFVSVCPGESISISLHGSSA